MLTPPENFQTHPKNLDPSRMKSQQPPKKSQPPKHAFLNPPPKKNISTPKYMLTFTPPPIPFPSFSSLFKKI